MKKILAVLLALLMLFSFVACGGGADTESESESESDTSTEAPGTETQAPDSESESDTETDPVTESESETEPSVEDIFVDRDETVYVNGADALNVRANNKIDANNVVGTLKEADIDVPHPLLKEVCEEIVKRYVTSFIPDIPRRQ